MQKKEVIQKATDLFKKENHKLLYLTKFGSHLYGLNTPNSDLDFKGIFLPSQKSLLLGKKCRSLSFSSGDDNYKNTNQDFDIELWSLHYFLELVRKGETNSLDMLFSHTNPDAVVFQDESINELFNNHDLLFNPADTNAFMGYAIGQAKKYGIKGTRLGVLDNIYNYAEHIYQNKKWSEIENLKLKDITDDLFNNFGKNEYFYPTEANGEPALFICGKTHLLSISFNEFYGRVKRDHNKYGNRTKKAMKDEGLDWKAISHSIRAIEQTKQLLQNGYINFPLKNDICNDIIKVKNGQKDWDIVHDQIKQGIEEVDEIKNSGQFVQRKPDNSFIENYILDLYDFEKVNVKPK